MKPQAHISRFMVESSSSVVVTMITEFITIFSQQHCKSQSQSQFHLGVSNWQGILEVLFGGQN